MFWITIGLLLLLYVIICVGLIAFFDRPARTQEPGRSIQRRWDDYDS